MENTLFIIDGNSILYREYYALPGLTNRHGEYTGALFGFSKVITEIITKYSPKYLAVAFDAGKITFRNGIYDGYKATRKPMPEDLRSQVEPVKSMLKTMGVKIVEKQGIEGDDVIGSLVNTFKDVNKVIVTGDRDSYQLVDKNTVVYLNKKGLSDIKILDEAEIFNMFNLTPSQMVYVKALQGDTSDNIPGVKGVGEKTALSLICKYGSLDGVYENISSITGSLKEKLETYRDDAYMSLKLAKIKCNEDLGVSLKDLEVKFPFSNEVKELFLYNDFKSLYKRDDIFETSEATNEVRINKVNLVSLENVSDITKVLSGCGEFAFFFSAGSLHLSVGGTECVLAVTNENEKDVINALKPYLENAKIKKVVFDSKKDKHVLARFGVLLKGDIFDCMIAKHLISGESVTEVNSIFNHPDEINEVASIMLSRKGEYIENLERMGMKKLYTDLELPLSDVLFNMELVGFKVDRERLVELDRKYEKEIQELTNEIYDLVGYEFNINSPKQLSKIIYDDLMLSRSKKKSTASEELEKIVDRHPMIPLIIRYRKVAKFLNSFIKNMYGHLDDNDFVHTCFNQTLTSTGRLSSSDPNLQNVPIRGAESREIRSMFVARDFSRVLVDVDYSQIELRILADVTGDEILKKAFNENLDIHTQTAMEIFGVPSELVTSEMRRQAKVVNFGIIYGISDFGLSNDLKISVGEAKRYIENFFTAHPKVREYMEKSVEIAKETGRVSTILGRTRKMTDINSSNYQIRSRAERATYNMPIQGTASDIIKLAMVKVFNELKDQKLDANLIMQVHDELIVDARAEDQEKVLKLVKDCMENAIKLSVPLDTDGSIGYRWSEGH